MTGVTGKVVSLWEMGRMIEPQGFFGGEGDRPRTAREERIARARDKEHVRLALSSLARHGYYVFDEVITDGAGLLDFLTVGPPGVIVVVVRFEEGCVGFGSREWEILLDGEPFEDDPFRQGADLIEEIRRDLFNEGEDVTGIVCFPRTDFELDGDRKPPLGTTPVWELPWALDPEGREEKLTPADVEEVAEKIREVYGRPPIVTPGRDE